jgi:hypothetical protein
MRAIASIDIPGSWKPEAFEHGVEAQTEDGSFYLSVVAVENDKGLQADVDATKAALSRQRRELA